LAFSYQQSAISYQLSAISYQLSVVGSVILMYVKIHLGKASELAHLLITFGQAQMHP